MQNFFRKLFRTFFSKNFVQFCLLGVVNTFNAAWISSVCYFIIQPNVAAIIGYIFSLTFAYFLSCYIIFKSSPGRKGYIRFLISYIPNFIIYFLVTFVTINTLHLPQFWATVLAAMAGGPITFVIIKLYAFGKKDP